MRLIAIFILTSGLGFIFSQVHSQTKEQLSGEVSGKLKDTTRNLLLRAATVSVYNSQDSSLLNYQLTNAYAEFKINGLPLNVPLKLDVSFTGYRTVEKNFTIPADSKVFDFEDLYMQVKEITLKEVQVRIPPITMNGDTLEITPSAFKLDSNDVIENVLKHTPGIEIWGDGTITVNGKEIKQLTVDGKSFFGGNFKIALQNIPNKSVQAIQVYKEPNEKNLLDSSLTMNVKLKNDRKFGLFGKLSVGSGTRKRNAEDGSMNMYNSKMQLGLLVAQNNVNEKAESIEQLLENATFQGINANVSSQPDFRSAGISTTKSGGGIFKYDFLSDPKADRKSSFNADYFVQHKDFKNLINSETQTTVGIVDEQYNNLALDSRQISTDRTLNSTYELLSENSSLKLSQVFATGDTRSTDNSQTSSFNDSKTAVSSNELFNSNKLRYQNFKFDVNYQRKKDTYPQTGFPPINNLLMKYELLINRNQDNPDILSDFHSSENPSQNKKINRKYDNDRNVITHNFQFEFPKIDDIIKPNGLTNFDLVFANNFNISNEDSKNTVSDLDSLTRNFVNNAYLTNHLQTNVTQEIPEIRVEKVYYQGLTNRFIKSIKITLAATNNFINSSTTSMHAAQNIDRHYSRFLPKASVIFSDNQYGRYNRSLDIQYQNEIQIPTLQQIAPLTDSIDVYSLYKGNPNLKESTTHSMSVTFGHTRQKSQNAFSFNIKIKGSIVSNAIVDSIYIDEENKKQIYYANSSGQKVLTSSLIINKALDLKNGGIQFRISSTFNFMSTPDFINGVRNITNAINSDHLLKIYYAYKDFLAVELSSTFSPSKSKQLSFNTEYRSENYSNSISASYNLTKRLNVSSNVIYDVNNSSNNKTLKFTIWNASVKYRLLRGNDAEVKLSALDLLNQNSNIINYTGSNYSTIGTQTTLRQYFMLSITYFPRFFGKKHA